MAKKYSRTCIPCAFMLYSLLCQFTVDVNAEPFSLLIGGAAIAGISIFYGTFQFTKCNFFECCTDDWVWKDKKTLADKMRKQLYGQHLAQQTVVGAIDAHWKDKNPKKALVMSFHGWTGSGKNYLSSMIADSMFKKGLKSNYVHLFVSTLHFSDSYYILDYQRSLRDWIHGNVSECERSLFIFDEIDKMPAKVMDAIKPFLDHYDNLEGVDYRKSIFIFLSNSGGNEIAQKALKHYEAGKVREQITLQEMEKILIEGAFNAEGGLKTSELISRHLIDHFIPFLPLERRHILLCIRDYLESKGFEATEKRITDIAESLQYFPKTNAIYSSSGCKRVAQKTDLYLSNEMEAKRKHLLNTELDDLL